jgi:molybdate transport system permease protein
MQKIDWFPLFLSLRVAILSTALVAVAGSAAGWLLARKNFRGREALDALFTLPLVLPPTVLGYYLLTLLARRGFVGRVIALVTNGGQVVFTWQGAVIAAFIGALPLMVKTARAGFAAVETDFEDAARTLGRNEWQVFRQITLPLAARSLAAAAALAFARSLGDFGATLMIAGDIPQRTQTAAIAIYDATQAGRDGEAATLALILSAVAFVLVYATNKLTNKSEQ